VNEELGEDEARFDDAVLARSNSSSSVLLSTLKPRVE